MKDKNGQLIVPRNPMDLLVSIYQTIRATREQTIKPDLKSIIEDIHTATCVWLQDWDQQQQMTPEQRQQEQERLN